MTKKLTAAKLKAHLAMIAFVVVAAATTGLTSVGVVEYVTLNVTVETGANLADVRSGPLAAASAASVLTAIQGK